MSHLSCPSSLSSMPAAYWKGAHRDERREGINTAKHISQLAPPARAKRLPVACLQHHPKQRTGVEVGRSTTHPTRGSSCTSRRTAQLLAASIVGCGGGTVSSRWMANLSSKLKSGS